MLHLCISRVTQSLRNRLLRLSWNFRFSESPDFIQPIDPWLHALERSGWYIAYARIDYDCETLASARSLPQTPRFSYTAVLYLMQEVSQFSSHWSTLRLHSLLNAHETSDTTCVYRVSGNAEISIAPKNEQFHSN